MSLGMIKVKPKMILMNRKNQFYTFMAPQNEVIDENFCYDGSYALDNDLHSFEELSNAFNELHDDMTSLCNKYGTLKDNYKLEKYSQNF